MGKIWTSPFWENFENSIRSPLYKGWWEGGGARNYRSNIPSSCLNKQDFNNRIFVCNVFTLFAENMNYLLLKWKFTNVKDPKIVQFMWEKFVPNSFCKHVCNKQIFCKLNSLDCNFPTVEKILLSFFYTSWKL